MTTKDPMEKGIGIWLATNLFGPILGWIIGSPSFIGFSENDWQIRYSLRILLAVIVPTIVSLIYIRNLKIQGVANPWVPILFTLLSTTSAWSAFTYLAVGSKLDSGVIREIGCAEWGGGTGTGARKVASYCRFRVIELENGAKYNLSKLPEELQKGVKLEVESVDEYIIRYKIH